MNPKQADVDGTQAGEMCAATTRGSDPVVSGHFKKSVLIGLVCFLKIMDP